MVNLGVLVEERVEENLTKDLVQVEQETVLPLLLLKETLVGAILQELLWVEEEVGEQVQQELLDHLAAMGLTEEMENLQP